MPNTHSSMREGSKMRWKQAVYPLLTLAGLVSLLACALEPDDEDYRCSTVCQKLSDKGCVFASDLGAGGATFHGSDGCVSSCNDALYHVPRNDCSREWEAFADCLMGDSQLACDGYWLDQVNGCDDERLAWDRCDGKVCDRRGGLSGIGTTSDGQPYSVDYGWLDCDCEAGRAAGELGGTTCGGVACPAVCCCGGQVAAAVCIDDQCASAAEACALLQKSPYPLCAADGS